MAGDLGQNYRDFWQPDNSLDHSMVGRNVISVEVTCTKVKCTKNIKFSNFEFQRSPNGFPVSDLSQSRLTSKS
jgi:hypothetical protein